MTLVAPVARRRAPGPPGRRARSAPSSLPTTGAVLLEYPVWLWHWATPGRPGVPWADAAGAAAVRPSVVLKRPRGRRARQPGRAASPAPRGRGPAAPRVPAAFDRDVEVFVDRRAAAERPARRRSSTRATPGAATRGTCRRAGTSAASGPRRSPRSPTSEVGSVLEIGCSIGMLTGELARRVRAAGGDRRRPRRHWRRRRSGPATSRTSTWSSTTWPTVCRVVPTTCRPVRGRLLPDRGTPASAGCRADRRAHRDRHPGRVPLAAPRGGVPAERRRRCTTCSGAPSACARLLLHVEDDFVLEAWSRDDRARSRPGRAWRERRRSSTWSWSSRRATRRTLIARCLRSVVAARGRGDRRPAACTWSSCSTTAATGRAAIAVALRRRRRARSTRGRSVPRARTASHVARRRRAGPTPRTWIACTDADSAGARRLADLPARARRPGRRRRRRHRPPRPGDLTERSSPGVARHARARPAERARARRQPRACGPTPTSGRRVPADDRSTRTSTSCSASRRPAAVVVACDEGDVLTSGRTTGRTPGGYARYLRTALSG